MLEVKEQKVNDLQWRMVNMLEQLWDKEKHMGSLKERVKSLQVDTSNMDTALTSRWRNPSLRRSVSSSG